MKYLMGIDLGTSGVKVLLIDEKGEVKAKDVQEYPLYTPRSGWAEQNPEEWWQGTVKAIKKVLKGIEPSSIAGIGLSGQMHGLVLLDKGGRVLRPAILWCDQRTVKQCEHITKKIGAERLIKLVSNPALTGFTAGKILWVREQEPEIYKKTAKILLPKDYIRFRLTGSFATEVSDASGTLLLDVKNRRWSDTILKELKIDKNLLPECFESEAVSGKISKKAGITSGLAEGTPVVGGGGDQAASALGCGAVEPGIVSVNLGTSGVVFAYTGSLKLDSKGRIHTFCHAVNGVWHTMGVMLSAGGSLKWFKDNLCVEEIKEARAAGVDPYEIILKKAAKAPIGSGKLIFLPYLAGERTPYADPYARGVFLGLGLDHKKEHLIRAVLEGVSFGLRDSVEIMKTLKVPVRQVRVSGGGAKSKFWLKMLADIFNAEIVTVNAVEGGAYGVALLAGVGAGLYPDIKSICKKVIKKTSSVFPEAANRKIYDAYYKQYKNAYAALKEEFRSLERLN